MLIRMCVRSNGGGASCRPICLRSTQIRPPEFVPPADAGALMKTSEPVVVSVTRLEAWRGTCDGSRFTFGAHHVTTGYLLNLGPVTLTIPHERVVPGLFPNAVREG